MDTHFRRRSSDADRNCPKMKESQQGVGEGGVGGCGNRAGLANLLLIFKQQAKTIHIPNLYSTPQISTLSFVNEIGFPLSTK